MKIEIIKCDICGKEGSKTRHFFIENYTDASGSSDSRHKSLDLCADHSFLAYELCEKREYKVGHVVYDILKKMVKVGQ